jgi:hypothetical protein
MTVSTVGVTKKRVRVIEQKTNHSIEYENDVYVVDTADPTLVLQTGSSSGVDLTGSNTLSSQADSTTTIASGANSTATIGSGNLSTVNLGTGTNTITKIGTSASGNSTLIRSRDISIGTTSGSHNIYIGESSTSSSDSINIGTSTRSDITIGNNAADNTLYVNSRNLTVGSRSGGTHSDVTIQGNTLTTKATSNYDLKAQGNVVLVANDTDLNGTGTRTYLSMISGAATLAHVDSSNTIQANCSLSSGTATVFGLTESKLDSDASAIVESPNTIITGTNSLVFSSPSSSIKHVVEKTNPGNYGNTAYSISGSSDFTSQGVSNFNKGTVTIRASQVTTNLANDQITGHTLASQITMSPSSQNNNIYARSASGILLRSNDPQLNNELDIFNASGYYAELNGKAELRAVDPAGSILGKVTVNNTSAAMNSSGSIAMEAGSTLGLTADTLVSIASGTSTIITTTKGNIGLYANSDNSTFGDIILTADNDVTVTATKGDITLNANSTDDTLGDIKLNSDNDVAVTTTKGNITFTANSDDATKGDIQLSAHNYVTVSTVKGNIEFTANSTDSTFGDININADNDININADNGININSDTNAITCRTLSLDALTDNINTAGEISMYSDGFVEILSGNTKTGTESTERRTGLVVRNEDITFRRRVGGTVYTAGYGNGSAADSYPVPSTAGDRFYSSSGFYSGVGTSFGGNASSSGYAPFTGVHMFDIQPDSNISIGDAVIVVNRTAMLTTTPNDKRVVGIVCEILENNRISVASVGDNECGQLKGFKVCNENGTISAGDLLTTSSTAGYLMKQSDDIMRSYTVGKSAVDVVFDNNNLAVDVYGFIYCG